MRRCGLLGLLTTALPAAAWQGALVSVDISPTAEQVSSNDIFLGGYGALGFRDGATLGFARGVADPIWARALWVADSAGEATAIVVLDATGIGNVVRDAIREGVAAATGLSAERVLVSATHTHCGPDLQGMWGGVSDSYRATAVQGAVNAVAWAAGNRTEVELHVSSLADETSAALQNNRRGWGFTLNSSTVLAIRSVANGATIGLMVNWAAHPTTLGRSVMELSADFGGFLCRHLEQAVPGATAMWVNAALGDVSNAGATGEGFERPRSYGVAAAEVALDAVRSGQTLVQDRLEMQAVAYEVPIDNIAFVAAYLLGVLDGYYVMAPGEGVNAPTFAVHLRFGAELEMVSTPGESLTRNALPVVQAIEQRGAVPMVLGLTQDSIGYFVPEDEWMIGLNGDYEEGVAPSRDAGDRLRDILLSLVQDLPPAPTPAGVYTQPPHLKDVYAANKTSLRGFLVDRGGWR